MSLTRWGPMGEFISLREAVDRLFEDSVLRPFDGFGAAFAVDIHETDKAFVIKAALPGVKPEQIDIEATDEGITIKAELKEETEVRSEQYLRKERRYGKFQRSFTLPSAIDPNKVEATFKDGIATITLPKSEVVTPKQIKVKVTA